MKFYLQDTKNQGLIQIKYIPNRSKSEDYCFLSCTKGETTNAARTAPICVAVTEDYAMIYVMATDNGIAGYKFVTEKPATKSVATPTFSVEEGEYQAPVSLEIQSTTPSAIIHYTLDGTEPTESSPIYTEAIELTETATVKAKAWLTGFNPSDIATATYTIAIVKQVVADPTFAPEEGEYQTIINVEITSTTPDAVIRYTLDGTEPTESSPIYTEAIAVSKTTTIKAKAWLEGFDPSNVVEATYTIKLTGINETGQAETKVYGDNNQIIVEIEEAGSIVTVYNLNGQQVATVVTTQGRNAIDVAKGIYIVKVGTKSTKVAL